MTSSSVRRALGCLLIVPALNLLGCSGDGVTNNSAAVQSMTIAQSDYFLGLGGTRQVDLFAYDDRGNWLPVPAGVTWTSSDPTLVTVDSTGTVRGVALGGPVTITATFGGMTASSRATVRPAAVTISPALDSILFGQSVQLTATARDVNGAAVEAGPVTWSISPPNVATISPTGLLTAGTGGTFTVTATIDAVAGQLSTGVSSQFDGTWVGTGTNSYGQPQAVRFNVRFGLMGLFVIPDVRTSCGPTVTTQYTVVLGVPVVADQFRYSVSSVTIAGAFTSPATVTGTYGLSLMPVPCMDFGSSGWILVSSAFTATKQ